MNTPSSSLKFRSSMMAFFFESLSCRSRSIWKFRYLPFLLQGGKKKEKLKSYFETAFTLRSIIQRQRAETLCPPNLFHIPVLSAVPYLPNISFEYRQLELYNTSKKILLVPCSTVLSSLFLQEICP